MIKIILCIGQNGERVSLRHQQQAMIKQSSEDATAAGSTAKKNLAPTSAGEQPAKKNVAPISEGQPAKKNLVASTEKSTMKRSAKAKDKAPPSNTPVAPILAEKKRKQGKQFKHYYKIYNFCKIECVYYVINIISCY
jgi:hypothetical protein